MHYALTVVTQENSQIVTSPLESAINVIIYIVYKVPGVRYGITSEMRGMKHSGMCKYLKKNP